MNKSDSKSNVKTDITYLNNQNLIKIWSCLILLLVCIIILMHFFYRKNFNMDIPSDKFLDYRIISALNPRYPPPLFNFMN
jgi:hypothetical protein